MAHVDITVRRLSQGDESTLVDIVRRHKARTIGADYATRLLANPLNFLLVAEHEQHPVGPDARRQRVGTALMNFMAAYAKEHCLMEAFVFSDSHNLAAQGLYEGTGATKAEDLSAIFLYSGGAP
jgi:GNAT superfamily N-acetyltransferase